MKTILLACCSLLLASGAFGQVPSPAASPDFAATATPFAQTAPAVAIPTPPNVAIPPPPPVAATTPFAAATPFATATPASNSVTLTVTSSSTPSPDDDIDQAIERKIRKHFNFTKDRHIDVDDDAAWVALPIVFIVFLAIFGMPVLIVAVILYFSFSKNRAMHKTVRMMVEKGQPVPESLLNPPPVVRQRSDLRRGIKWMLVGIGLMIFFGACNDWEGGAWSLGIIPFLIGAGYLIFWRLDISKEPVVRETVIREDTSPRV